MSNVFENTGDMAGENGVARGRAQPPPFLTEENAVNTHNRLGGYVNQNDSLVELGQGAQGVAYTSKVV